METQRNLSRAVTIVAMVTLTLLSVPLIAMQFTNEVDWSVFDFFIMGILIFGTGVSYVVLTHFTSSLIYRLAVAGAIGTTFLMIWANLAVGLIGGGPHAGNFLYLLVIAIVIVGTVLSRFTAKGMEKTMFGAALAVVMIALIALSTGMQYYPESSTAQILGVNAFFAGLYSVAGLLFRFIALKEAPSGPDTD